MGLIEVIVPAEQEGSRAVVRHWLKRPGERVAQDDPLVELETDKVTQEIAAPAAGILHEIVMQSDEIVTPGAVLARIDPTSDPVAPPTGAPAAARQHSPAVRRLAAEYGIDPGDIAGSGKGGRVTREDMQAAHRARGGTPAPQSCSRRVPHSPMRLAIARNMAESVARAPHVTALAEVDFTAVTRHRAHLKPLLAAQGINLSLTPYLVVAAAAALRAVPEVNSHWHEDALEIHADANIGIGTALGDAGLVVPVIRKAQDLTLEEVAGQLQELTARARAGRLSAAEMAGGSFTISNHGTSGTLLAAPVILHDGQSAILGVGKLERRAVVRDAGGAEALAIRTMAHVTLTIDHRALDGHQTGRWLSAFAARIEGWEAPPG
ncbi:MULTISPECIES: dihydrolipoamide acetyltransferase family protein [Paracoccus]|jgi:2-oxoglutarate dehydrogenase E2 component (dihydrolipoamide succinyltransferase)|uniref:dihydrolipoamide acetyltransferase family protein n=1 Tax=Paracoccus TaxID=265 RepID=UPI00258F3F8F|nr:2-oxo acid dehydrogenase subunit E2 [Paracoccus sp. (in: a-proteobacteria)]